MSRKARLLAALALAAALGGCRSKLPYEDKSEADLERMLRDPDPKVQAQAAYGISLNADAARRLVPELTAALNSKDTLVREGAARALAKAGPQAGTAVPALTTALADPAWTVQRQAALALRRGRPFLRSKCCGPGPTNPSGTRPNGH